jgi:predicted phosphoribosyltransferase
VRKLGVPGHAELALGPIATGGVRVLNTQLIDSLGIPRDWVEAIDAKEMRELERWERAYRGDRPPPDLTDRVVILVDDGLTTGSTMLVLLQRHAFLGVKLDPHRNRRTAGVALSSSPIRWWRWM